MVNMVCSSSPAASLLVDEYLDHDWSGLWWVRVDGAARIVKSSDEWTQAMGLLADKYPQYQRTPPPGPVVAIDVTTWRAWP